MKKGLFKCLLIISLLSIGVLNVDAASDCNFTAKASYSGGTGHISVGGKNYDASCDDKGFSALTSTVTCHSVSETKWGTTSVDNEMSTYIQKYYDAGPGSSTYTYAMRLTKVLQGEGRTKYNGPSYNNADDYAKILGQYIYSVQYGKNDRASSIYKENKDGIFKGVSEKDAKAICRTAINTYNSVKEEVRTGVSVDKQGATFASENDYFVQPLLAKFDNIENRINLGKGGGIVIECETGGGNSRVQRYSFVLNECPTEEEEEEEEECVNGFMPDGSPCEEEPEEAGECGGITPQIHGGGNNCCSDSPTTDKMWEDELKDLFCEHPGLGVKYYYAKSGADYYLDDYANGQLGDSSTYCQIYCTQKAQIWQPGTITATNGRYFKLKDTNSKGTESAYVKSYKRCRVLIQYDIWETEYYNVVKNQVDNYNWYQEAYAVSKVYDSMYDVMGVEAGASGTCKEKRTNKDTGRLEDYVHTVYSGEEVPVAITHFSLLQYDYNTALINPELRIEGSKYDAISVEPNKWGRYDTQFNECIQQNSHTGGGVYRYIKQPEVIDPDDAETVISIANKHVAELPGMCGGTLSDAKPVYNVPCREKVPFTIEKIKDTLANTPPAYASAVQNAFDLEKKIYKCEAYLRKPLGEAMVLPTAYNVNTDMNFSYVQTYVDDSMRCVTDQQYVKFDPSGGNSENSVCHISGVFTAKTANAEIGVEEPQFSKNKYKPGYEVMTDCHVPDLSFAPIGAFLATERVPEDDPPGGMVIYPAWKSFSNDGWYESECYKNQGEFETKTTIPDGYTIVPDKNNSAKFLRNITVHKKQYYIYVTTLTGKYETFWEMSGVGENGVFDPKIMSETTCSGHYAMGGNLPPDMTCNAEMNGVTLQGPVYTCQLKVVSQVIETGKCNEPENPNCEYLPADNIKKEGFNYFNFKIVDPKNLFPACPTYGEGKCNYAWNWLEDPKGVEAKKEIEEDGKNDLTYSPDKITYSIKLTTKDIETIRAYNKAAGSYDDFNLSCEDCPQDYSCGTTISSPAAEHTCIESTSCKRCKSDFMSQLYSGYLTFGGRTESITPPKGNLNSIRENNKW